MSTRFAPRRSLCIAFSLIASSMLLAPSQPALAQTNYHRLKSFGFPQLSTGAHLQAGLIKGPDGLLYGTAADGGLHNKGVIFSVSTNGTNFKLLHSFSGADGANPFTALFLGNDGILYGTTSRGSAADSGSVFRMNPDGSAYAILHQFVWPEQPASALVQAADGLLYGTTYNGSTNGYGAIYRLATNGNDFFNLYAFTTNEGTPTTGALLVGPGNIFYGLTSGGWVNGTNAYGSVYSIDPSTLAYTNLFVFGNGPEGGIPVGGLLRANDGRLYGAASAGGNNSVGVLFRLDLDGRNFHIIYDFGQNSYAAFSPGSGLLMGPNSMLYGTTQSGGSYYYGTIYRVTTDGDNFAVILNFDPATSGASGSLLLDAAAARIYDTSRVGGDSAEGSVFSVDINNSVLTTLFSFTLAGGDATQPNSLVLASDGWLYGSTRSGGRYASGTLFKLSTNGAALSILHDFSGGNDGGSPNAGIIAAPDGALYGTTATGGALRLGTIFRLAPGGSPFQTVFNFDSSLGGRSASSVILGADGRLYGTTAGSGGLIIIGGPPATNNPIIFALNTDGTGFTILHQFPQAGFSSPFASRLIQGNDGAFYGIARDGLYFNQIASLFRMSSDGLDFSTIYSFSSTDYASDVLTQGPDGYLYGATRPYFVLNALASVFAVTTNGTDYSALRNFSGLSPTALHFATNGVLFGVAPNMAFKMNPDGGAYRELHRFSTDEGAIADFCIGSAGELYGVTSDGGEMGLGTIFALTTTTNPPTRTVQITDTVVYGPGEAVIPIGLAAQGDEHSLSFTVSFYPGFLQYESFDTTQGDSSAQVSVDTTDVAAGILHITITQPDAHVFTSGPHQLLSLRFLATSFAGTTFINFAPGGTIQDLNGQTLNTTWIDGSITLLDCTATISSLAIQAPAAGINQDSVSLTIGSSCPWSASTTNNWIHTPSSGVGFGSVSYSVDANLATSSRTGAIFVAGQTIVFTQDGIPISDALNLTINGRGTVTPDYRGQQLLTGHDYQLTATAHAGWTFSGWSGDVFETNATLHFTMHPGLSIIATFSPSPFILQPGTFGGMFMDANGPTVKSAGLVSFKVTSQGAFSGKLINSTNRYSLRGKFTDSGDATIAAKGRRKSSVQVQLHLGSFGALSGTISNTDWNSTFLAYPAFYDGKKRVSPFAGRYTMVLDTGLQAGHSYATLSATKSGTVRFSGSMADGAKVSYSVTSVASGMCPVVLPLNRGKGALQGWVYLSFYYAGGAYGYSPVSGQLFWIKPGLTNKTISDAGFTAETFVSGSLFDAPHQGERILSISNAVVELQGGPVTNTFGRNFILDSDNHVKPQESGALQLSFSKTTGLFHGRAKDSATNQKYSFNGVVLQGNRIGQGYFRTNGQSGYVSLRDLYTP